jgi:hypothetical protein
VGTLIDFSEYRAKKNGHPPDGIHIELVSNVMIVRHYHKGILIGEERVISERILRDMLDGMD